MRKIPFLDKIEEHSPERLLSLGRRLEYHTNRLGKECILCAKEYISFRPSEEEQMITALSMSGPAMPLISEAGNVYEKIKKIISGSSKN